MLNFRGSAHHLEIHVFGKASFSPYMEHKTFYITNAQNWQTFFTIVVNNSSRDFSSFSCNLSYLVNWVYHFCDLLSVLYSLVSSAKHKIISFSSLGRGLGICLTCENKYHCRHLHLSSSRKIWAILQGPWKRRVSNAGDLLWSRIVAQGDTF